MSLRSGEFTANLKRVQQESPGSILGQMVSVDQAAKHLGIATSTMYGRVRAGKSPKVYKYNGLTLFKRVDVLASK